jgi:hypothetical protein
MPCVACCHPSLFAGITFQGSKTPSESKNTWIIDRSSKKQCFSIFSGFLFAQTLWWGAATTFPSAPWTSWGMARTPVWVIEHFRCSWAPNSPGDVFLFSGRNREVRGMTALHTSIRHFRNTESRLHHLHYVTSLTRVQPIFTITQHNARTSSCQHGHQSAAVTTSAERTNTSAGRCLFLTSPTLYTKILSSSLKSDVQIIDPRPHLCANWTLCDPGHLHWQKRGALTCRHRSSNFRWEGTEVDT